MRRTISLAVSLATALAVVAVGATPAYADDQVEAVQLSFDGESWSEELRRPLFDPGFRWVPGDRETESFYVRNAGPSDATMTVAVETGDPDELLPDDIELEARAAGGEWVPLANGADLTPLLREEVDQDRQVRVDVRADFLWESTNQSMRDRLPLDFVVTLVQRGVLGDDTEDDGSDSNGLDLGGDGEDGVLPDTGSNVSLWIVLLGAALLGSGITLVAGRRRQEQTDE